MLVTYLIPSLRLCVDLDDVPIFCMIECYMTLISFARSHVACLCGRHMYPLISKPLVSIDSVSFDYVFERKLVAPCVLFNRVCVAPCVGYNYVLEHVGGGRHIDADWSQIFEELYSPKLDFRVLV